jgi:hypothetical protein
MSATEMPPCPICGSKLSLFRSDLSGSEHKCPLCGMFYLGYLATDIRPLQELMQ